MTTATASRTRPIAFRDHEVRDTIEGRKTQFRRPVTLGHPGTFRQSTTPGYDFTFRGSHKGRTKGPGSSCWQDYRTHELLALCPYGKPGDRLWVREAWRPTTWSAEGGWGEIDYRADGQTRTVEGDWSFSQAYPDGRDPARWRPSIHMPRWASRLTLEVTSVRVERLQEIDDLGAIAEGVQATPVYTHTGEHTRITYPERFASLWDAHNKKQHPWDSNPWVCAVSYSVVH